MIVVRRKQLNWVTLLGWDSLMVRVCSGGAPSGALELQLDLCVTLTGAVRGNSLAELLLDVVVVGESCAGHFRGFSSLIHLSNKRKAIFSRTPSLTHSAHSLRAR